MLEIQNFRITGAQNFTVTEIWNFWIPTTHGQEFWIIQNFGI